MDGAVVDLDWVTTGGESRAVWKEMAASTVDRFAVVSFQYLLVAFQDKWFRQYSNSEFSDWNCKYDTYLQIFPLPDVQ